MKYIVIVVLAVGIMLSCNKEKKKCKDFDASYNGGVKNIIERSCNNGDCHHGIIGGGWIVLPDFSSYENILPYLKSGKIEERLFTTDSILLMPPYMREERQLNDLEYEILSCWLNNGFPKN